MHNYSKIASLQLIWKINILLLVGLFFTHLGNLGNIW